METRAREIRETVEALNHCWTAGDPRDLERFFHPNMIAVTPATSRPLVGRSACVAAWSGYSRSTRIREWRTEEWRVQEYGETAVVTYRYELLGERDGAPVRAAGRDMMVLAREKGRWWLVADHFSPDPGGADL